MALPKKRNLQGSGSKIPKLGPSRSIPQFNTSQYNGAIGPNPLKKPLPGTMSKNPLLTKGAGVGLGLLALSHAKNSMDSLRYGDMTTAALNAGVAGAAGYGAYHMVMGSHKEIGSMLRNKAATPMLHGLRSMKTNYAGNPEAIKSINAFGRNVIKGANTLRKFFA